jgi:acyl-CoA reductase-like NAD-dependent aldehyde dehydrogenase
MQVAEQTPLTAARYGELALEAGIPPGVLNVIQGGAPRCLETPSADNSSAQWQPSTAALRHSTRQGE